MSGRVEVIADRPVFVCAREGPPIDGERAATDIIGDLYGSGADLAVIPVERLGEGFLTLSTRIAGEVTQKFVNYGLSLAILGDMSAATARSGALADYVRECNRGRHIWFVADMADLEARLAARR